jgi:hypothetical protein
VGVDLALNHGEVLLDRLDSVGAGDEAQRQLIGIRSVTSAGASFLGSAPCLPFMPFQPSMVCAVRSA